MPKVPMVNDRDLDKDRRGEFEWVTSFQCLEKSSTVSSGRPVVILEIGVFHRGIADGRTISLALSPPAAHQLSSRLQEAVVRYLQSSPDDKARG